MIPVDDYGRLILSDDDLTPTEGWAYIEFVGISSDLIFANRADAKGWALLHGDSDPTIVKVVVTGHEIERA